MLKLVGVLNLMFAADLDADSGRAKDLDVGRDQILLRVLILIGIKSC